MSDRAEDIADRTRYEALIECARQTRSLWIAESEDAVLTLEDECGDELLLVWPTEESARETIAARPNLEGFKPVVRSLDRWLGTTTRSPRGRARARRRASRRRTRLPQGSAAGFRAGPEVRIAAAGRRSQPGAPSSPCAAQPYLTRTYYD